MADAHRSAGAWTEVLKVGRQFGKAAALSNEIEKRVKGVEGKKNSGQTVRRGKSRAFKAGKRGYGDTGAGGQFRLRQARMLAGSTDKTAKCGGKVARLDKGYGCLQIHNTVIIFHNVEIVN